MREIEEAAFLATQTIQDAKEVVQPLQTGETEEKKETGAETEAQRPAPKARSKKGSKKV